MYKYTVLWKEKDMYIVEDKTGGYTDYFDRMKICKLELQKAINLVRFLMQ